MMIDFSPVFEKTKSHRSALEREVSKGAEIYKETYGLVKDLEWTIKEELKMKKFYEMPQSLNQNKNKLNWKFSKVDISMEAFQVSIDVSEIDGDRLKKKLSILPEIKVIAQSNKYIVAEISAINHDKAINKMTEVSNIFFRKENAMEI